MLKINTEFQITERYLRGLRTREIPRARKAALNRAATAGRAAGNAMASDLLGLKKSITRKKFAIAKAKGGVRDWKSTSAAVYFRAYVTGDAGKVKLRQTPTGVTAGAKETPHAFIPGWVENQFNERNRVFKRKGRSRYPIIPATVDIPAQHVKPIERAMMKAGSDMFRKRFQHELDWRIKKSGARKAGRT